MCERKGAIYGRDRAGTLTKRDRKRIPSDVRHDRQIEGRSDERSEKRRERDKERKKLSGCTYAR